MKKGLPLLLTVACTSESTVSCLEDACDIAIIYVDASATDAPNGSEALPFPTVDGALAAIQDRAETFTLQVRAGAYVERLTLRDDVRIVGEPGAVLTSPDDEGVVRVRRGEVTLEGLELVGGEPVVSVSGGTLTGTRLQVRDGLRRGVFADGGAVLLDDVLVEGTTLSESSPVASGIAVEGARLVVTNSVVRDIEGVGVSAFDAVEGGLTVVLDGVTIEEIRHQQVGAQTYARAVQLSDGATAEVSGLTTREVDLAAFVVSGVGTSLVLTDSDVQGIRLTPFEDTDAAIGVIAGESQIDIRDTVFGGKLLLTDNTTATLTGVSVIEGRAGIEVTDGADVTADGLSMRNLDGGTTPAPALWVKDGRLTATDVEADGCVGSCLLFEGATANLARVTVDNVTRWSGINARLAAGVTVDEASTVVLTDVTVRHAEDGVQVYDGSVLTVSQVDIRELQAGDRAAVGVTVVDASAELTSVVVADFEGVGISAQGTGSLVVRSATVEDLADDDVDELPEGSGVILSGQVDGEFDDLTLRRLDSAGIVNFSARRVMLTDVVLEQIGATDQAEALGVGFSEGSDTVVDGLTLRDCGGYGLQSVSATVQLTDVLIEDTAVRPGRESAIGLATYASTVDATRLAVRGTDGLGWYDRQTTATCTDCTFEDNRGIGIDVVGGTLSLIDTTIADTRPHAALGGGTGLSSRNYVDGSVSLVRTTISAHPDAAVVLAGTGSFSAEDSDLSASPPSDDLTGPWGQALFVAAGISPDVWAGPGEDDPASVTLRDTRIHEAGAPGAFLGGASMTVEGGNAFSIARQRCADVPAPVLVDTLATSLACDAFDSPYVILDVSLVPAVPPILP